MAGSSMRCDEFGRSLADAARSILADAQQALADPALTDAQAVHELRKALKRWRALLRLLQPAIGKPAETMRRGARALMRRLAVARDAQAALDALDDLAKADAPLSPTSLEAMRGRIAPLRGSAEGTALTPDLRARIGAYLAGAARELERWALPRVRFAAIADALAATYRRARRLRPRDWHAAASADLHALRRRVIEHRHQMELIEPLWPKRGKIRAGKLQRLRRQLGACQDLAVLERFLAPRRALAPWRAQLMPTIAVRRTEHLRIARRLAGRLFAEKPKAFRKRIGMLWDARRRRNARCKTAARRRPS